MADFLKGHSPERKKNDYKKYFIMIASEKEGVQSLINQVGILMKKNNEILDLTGSRFNLFRIFGVNHDENKHSAILAELLNPRGSHGQKEMYLSLFQKFFIKDDLFNKFKCENAIVKTEYPTNYGRIDIFIDDRNGYSFIIENKIYAQDQWEQLKRYEIYLKNRPGVRGFKIFYLTLRGSEASVHSGGGIDYKTISYEKDIIKWLKECVKYSAQLPIVRESLIQYINHIKKLTNTDMSTNFNNDIVDLMAKSENIEIVFKMNACINLVKSKVINDMAKRISEKVDIDSQVRPDLKGFGFFKKSWKKGSQIFFGDDSGKVYYSLKTPEAINGLAQIKSIISEYFDKKPDRYNPFGFGHVYPENWLANSQVYNLIVDQTFEDDYIIPRLKDVLKYLENHPEIEKDL